VEEIIDKELDILSSLDFNVDIPTCYNYLELISVIFDLSSKEFAFANFILEIFIQSSISLSYKESNIAASSCFIMMKIIKRHNPYKLLNLLGYSSDYEIKKCAKQICKVINLEKNLKLCNTRIKFSDEKYFEVGKFTF